MESSTIDLLAVGAGVSAGFLIHWVAARSTTAAKILFLLLFILALVACFSLASKT